MPVTARAQQKITFANARTVTVNVTVGKSQDIHTDQGVVAMVLLGRGHMLFRPGPEGPPRSRHSLFF